MREKEILEELIHQNKMLQIKVDTLQERLDEYKGKMLVLSRMTEEWAKSYDNLLKDFISYRNRSN